MNCWTIDQLQSLRQVAVGGAFAFAGKFALRLSEDLQKFVPFRRVNQFNGFRTTGHACEFLRLTSDRTDGIQQLLGRQHASSRVTEVDFVVSVIFVSLRAELIDAAVHDRPNQMTLREPTLQKLVGQIAQQLRIGWRIGIAEVIHRIHNTFAHDMPPNAIREGLRKEWIWTVRSLAGIQVVLILSAWLWIQFPVLVHLPGGDLTLFNSHAPDRTLFQLAAALLVGSAFILPSLFYLFQVFKLDEED